ncbi:hydrogen peroxide-inducible genes activator [Catalinimonas niigatensis]|uniref:hydrogen peroxide-inducible genes activator n=1 Tax=Catalinimonas niigatensis TaxID=1397264 RepID=UPI00266541B8|nr:hydrogen peroxide-inducible genes activator [Catalinimonas niigatensis]WPP50004.1 LysR substrate-binding domain-containing protein [Catalinimonas niigatensis]
MTIEQLQYALSVYQHSSFIKAADASHVSQPALTMQIKNLEVEVGFMLFDRTYKPLRVTEAGKTFLEKAKEVLLSVQGLKNLAEELRAYESGVLKIGMIPTLAPYLLPLFIRQFNEQYPEIELHITELTTEEVLSSLKDGKLDAGMIATPVSGKGLHFKALFYEHFYIYVSEDHPWYRKTSVQLDQIAGKDLWLLKEGNCFRNQVNDLCHLGKKTEHEKLTYESNSIASLMRIVEHQGGLTFIPELATLGVNPQKENMLKNISGQRVVREISLVFSRSHYKQKLLDKLESCILQNIPHHMRSVGNNEVVDSFIKY